MMKLKIVGFAIVVFEFVKLFSFSLGLLEFVSFNGEFVAVVVIDGVASNETMNWIKLSLFK